MKKLLTTITLSALVGSSTSNLKPVFTNNSIIHNFKSNQVNSNISIQNENDTNPFSTLMIKEKIESLIIKILSMKTKINELIILQKQLLVVLLHVNKKIK